jgi:hypothetical protein
VNIQENGSGSLARVNLVAFPDGLSIGNNKARLLGLIFLTLNLA